MGPNRDSLEMEGNRERSMLVRRGLWDKTVTGSDGYLGRIRGVKWMVQVADRKRGTDRKTERDGQKRGRISDRKWTDWTESRTENRRRIRSQMKPRRAKKEPTRAKNPAAARTD